MKEIIEERLIELIEEAKDESDKDAASRAYQIYMGAITIAAQLYGPESVQVEELKGEKIRIADSKWAERAKFQVLISELRGILTSFLRDLNSGLVQRLENEARGDVYADFIALSKECLESGSKDVAAVLACAALEDSLKKHALSHGLDVGDDDMSNVINNLKANSLLKKPEAKILQSYVTLRIKSFHAQWEKIGEAEISSAIAFVERFVLLNFSGETI